MKTSYRKLKRDINKYNNNIKSARNIMNRMLQGGLMEYMAGGQVNPAAAMFGSNTEKISNMSSPLHGVDTGRMQIGYPKAAYGMSMDTYNMGGYSPSYSIPQGQMGMPVMKQTNDAGMSYAMPVMYQQGGQAMPNSQDIAMAMAQQEGAPMPPMQQQAPEQNQEAMMQELTALAQAALSGDEEAIKIIEQLPEEQQQMILQIMEQMQAQGQGAEAGMNAGMEQGMQEGMEQMAMMYGGIMNTENSNKKNTTKKSKSKKKSYTSNQMKNGGYSVRKSSMNKLNKLYNTLGIPC